MLIDNLLSKSIFSLIQDAIVNDPTVAWGYISNTSGEETEKNKKYTGSFTFTPYNIKDGGALLQGLYQILLMPLLTAIDQQDQRLKFLYRIRVGMITRTPYEVIHGKHIDQFKDNLTSRDRTGIFYLNDSDGPTRIYDGNEVIDKINPISNRWYDMPADVYHASSTPTNHEKRIVVNYNYEIEG